MRYCVCRRKRNDVESYRVNGPVICIGDFDDGYNMPPPKVPTTKVVDDFDLSDVSFILSN